MIRMGFAREDITPEPGFLLSEFNLVVGSYHEKDKVKSRLWDTMPGVVTRS